MYINFIMRWSTPWAFNKRGDLNLFTAPACKMSGLKATRAFKQYTFKSFNTFTLSAVRFNAFSHASAKKIQKGFQNSHFYWSFSSDITVSKHGA